MKKMLILMTVLCLSTGAIAEILIYRYKLKGVELYRETGNKAYRNKGVYEKGYVTIEYDVMRDEFLNATLYKDMKSEKSYTVKEFLSENTKVKRETTDKGMSMIITDNKATIKGDVRTGVKIKGNHYLIASRLRGYSSWNSLYGSGAERIGSGRITLNLDKKKTCEAHDCTENELAEKVLKYEGYKLQDADSELTQDRDAFNNVAINGGTIDNVNIGLKTGSIVNGVFKALVVGTVDDDYMFPYSRGATGEVLTSNGDSTTKWKSISTIVGITPAPWNGSIDDALKDSAKNNLGLHTVASSGSYNDLSDKPAPFPEFGATGGTACVGDDNRLFNSRSWDGTFANDKERNSAKEIIKSFVPGKTVKENLNSIDAELKDLTGNSLKTVMNNIYSDPKTNLGSIMSRNQCDERYLNKDACLAELVMNREHTTTEKMTMLQRLRDNVGLGGFQTEFEEDVNGNIVMDVVNGKFVPRASNSKVTTNLDVEGDFTIGTLGDEKDISMYVADKTRWKVNDMNIDEFLGVDPTSMEDKFLDEANNLSDLANSATARGNLGLGTLATLNTVTTGNINNGTLQREDLNSSDFGGWVMTTNANDAKQALNINDSVPWDDVTGKPSTATRWSVWNEVTGKPVTATRWPAWNEVTGKPSFHAVATSGDYNVLINKPTIPSAANTVIAQHHAGNEWAWVRVLRDADGLRKLEYYNIMYVGGGTHSFTIPLTGHISGLQGFPSIMITDHSDAGAPSRNPYVTLIDGATVHFAVANNTQKVYIHCVWYGTAP